MRTHHAIRPAAPGFTGGGDEVRAKCAGEYELFWGLIDCPSDRILARRAAEFCRTCPLASTCLTRTDDPHWAAAAFTILRTITSPTKTRPAPNVENRQGFSAAAYQKRLLALYEFVDAGANVQTALSALHITRITLYRWCQRHDHLNLWYALLGDQEEAAS